MQSVSFRIWTRVAVSISYDDNHYTTGTSVYLGYDTKLHLMMKNVEYFINAWDPWTILIQISCTYLDPIDGPTRNLQPQRIIIFNAWSILLEIGSTWLGPIDKLTRNVQSFTKDYCTIAMIRLCVKHTLECS